MSSSITCQAAGRQVRVEYLHDGFAVQIEAVDVVHSLTPRFESAKVDAKPQVTARYALPNGIEVIPDLGGEDEVRVREYDSSGWFLGRDQAATLIAIVQRAVVIKLLRGAMSGTSPVSASTS